MKTETKEHRFGAGDLVVCNDVKAMEEILTEGQVYTVKVGGRGGSDLIEILSDRGRIEGAMHYRFSLYSRKAHPVGTIFSVLDEKEAEPYIGKEVEYIDNQRYKRNEPWGKGILNGFRHSSSNYSFLIKGNTWYHLIRLIPESFESPKPKVDPKLIEALKLSVQHWQIMCDTGKSKVTVYKFLGGDESGRLKCFLCDATGHAGDSENESCRKCIEWGDEDKCFEGTSPFRQWTQNNSAPNALRVLNHLKSELSRLEALSK